MSLEFKVVKNYAQALLNSISNVSNQNDMLEKESEILKQLKIFVQLMQGSKIIYNIFCSPAVGKETKNKVVDIFVSKYNIRATLKQFLYVLVKNARCDLLPQISDMSIELMSASKGVKSAEIISAFKLDRKQIQSIQKFIESKLNQEVEVVANTDSSLIGGVVIKYDSNIIDCSVHGALDRIEKIATKSKM